MVTVSDDDTLVVEIPEAVIAALGGDRTVDHLLDLANRELAGWIPSSPTAPEINDAVDAVNRGFDECRTLIACGDDDRAIPLGSRSDPRDAAPAGGEFHLYASTPNPMRAMTTIQLQLPERSRVHLAVYDVSGREIARLADGEVDAGLQSYVWQTGASDRLVSGVYFYRANVTGLQSGKRFDDMRKLLVVR